MNNIFGYFWGTQKIEAHDSRKILLNPAYTSINQ
jgi:hypothetical protein